MHRLFQRLGSPSWYYLFFFYANICSFFRIFESMYDHINPAQVKFSISRSGSQNRTARTKTQNNTLVFQFSSFWFVRWPKWCRNMEQINAKRSHNARSRIVLNGNCHYIRWYSIMWSDGYVRGLSFRHSSFIMFHCFFPLLFWHVLWW